MSGRYYIAESTVWLLGAILVVSRFVGLAPSQSLPLLNVTPENHQHFSRIVAVMLVAAIIYLFVEWKQSSKKARDLFWTRIRAGITTIWALISIWLSYPVITVGTRFFDISPAWYLFFFLIGYLLGTYASILIFASLMIRTQIEAKTLHLPRIPAATCAQYTIGIPVFSILIVVCYILWYFSPDTIKLIGLLFTAVPFLLLIIEGFVSLCLSQDENGNRIPYAKCIARLKEAHNSHDYSYFLINKSSKAIEEMGISGKSSPKEVQKVMQEKFYVKSSTDSLEFRTEVMEEIKLKGYAKDGVKSNRSPENRGIRIQKDTGNKNLLRVRAIAKDPKDGNKEMEIPINLVERYAEGYLANHTDENELTIMNAFSYAINQAVIKTMMEKAGPLLYRLTMAGLEDNVKGILKQNVDVNERAEYGWTALLSASAQGYPRILRLLLEAGGNPDIGNVNGITPLMYGARYGNLEIIKILLEYGANIDLQDTYGMTALIVASRDGHLNVVDKLLKAGANSTLKDLNGMTALDIAYKNKHGKIAKRLRATNKM